MSKQALLIRKYPSVRIYQVGGAVRDQLLGLKPTEVDWVVVGATAEQMKICGFKLVGSQFPVFLHPKTHEEYALARTEKKFGKGYKGFTVSASPEVTLAEDLQRRDLTINAMAYSAEGQLIDPYGGQSHLKERLLKHVSMAFVEDPLRVVRVARFRAQLSAFHFKISPETMGLMQKLVRQGEIAYLTPERVWQESYRSFGFDHYWLYLETLQQCGALAVLWPDIAKQIAKLLPLLKTSSLLKMPLARFALMLSWCFKDKPNALKPFTQRNRMPQQLWRLSYYTVAIYDTYCQLVCAGNHTQAGQHMVNLFYLSDAFRQIDIFPDLLMQCAVLASFGTVTHLSPAILLKVNDLLLQGLSEAKTIDTQSLLMQGYRGSEIGQQLRLRRERLVVQNIAPRFMHLIRP